MKKIKFPKSKKIKILIIATAVIAAAGVLFLLYPTFTNIVGRVRQAGALSEWEVKREAPPGEEIEPAEAGEEEEGAPAAAGEDDAGEDITSNIKEETENGEAGKEEINYSSLTAEDFFPLKIKIPKIELELIVNEGADTKTLKQGPGHIPETPLPGDTGRSAISGHRTTYGSPFRRIDSLEDGDLIYLETIKGELFIYAVTGLEIVKPQDVYILEGTAKRELLLTSCYPEYSAAERIILISELIEIYPLELVSGKNG